jgi:hypothetical protein
MLMKVEEKEEIPTVRAEAEMSSEHFALHMTHRHGDSLGGLSELDPTKMNGTEGAWRAFHRRLHETRIDLAHEHER